MSSSDEVVILSGEVVPSAPSPTTRTMRVRNRTNQTVETTVWKADSEGSLVPTAHRLQPKAAIEVRLDESGSLTPLMGSQIRQNVLQKR